MFRASLCPSSGEQDVCYCMWCAALVLLDVVGSGCGALPCSVRALWSTFTVLAPYNAAPHNRYQPHPAEPAHHTTCSNTRLVLLKMGIMMLETCWDSVDNKHLIVSSCWFSLSLSLSLHILRILFVRGNGERETRKVRDKEFLTLRCSPKNTERHGIVFYCVFIYRIFPNTDFMGQSLSWEANSSLARQELLRMLWNRKVHYRIHRSPPPVSVLSHMNTVHVPFPLLEDLS